MKSALTATTKGHGHLWLASLFGFAAGLLLMLYVPSLPAVSQMLFWFAGFHLVGGIILAGTLYITWWRPRRRRGDAIDFGWAPAWIYGPLLAALSFLAGAVAVQIAAPPWWPVAILLTLLAANAFAGHLAAAASARADHAALPLVDLLPAGQGEILDAGCGAGRTSIAVGRGFAQAHIVALDRFDSNYIEGGGRALLERNLALTGLADRARIEQGDMTALPFADASLDAAVSAHAIDHLGGAAGAALAEIRRVLKPGGRFLLVVWVRGWTLFAVANLLSLALNTRADWQAMAARAGFDVREAGSFNGHCYLLLEKPPVEENGRG